MEERIRYSNRVSVWKFIFFSIISFGIYEIVWFYRNWKFFKRKERSDIHPFWRAFFAVFFLYQMSKKILELARNQNRRIDFSPGLVTVGWIVIYFLFRLPDPYNWLSALTFLPLLKPLKAMNSYWEQVERRENLPQRPMSWWKIVLIILGTLYLSLALAGEFLLAV